MSWDDFHVFVTAAEAGSLMGAARQLEVHHTTVGRRLRALEDRLGVALFERDRDGLTLTRDGQILQEEAIPAVRQLEELGRRARGLRVRRRQLRLFAPGVLATLIVIPALRELHARCPMLSLHMCAEGEATDLTLRLGKGPHQESARRIVRRLAVVSFSVYRSPHHDGGRAIGYRIGDWTLGQACSDEGFWAEDCVTASRACEAGVGRAILPRFVARDLDLDEVESDVDQAGLYVMVSPSCLHDSAIRAALTGLEDVVEKVLRPTAPALSRVS